MLKNVLLIFGTIAIGVNHAALDCGTISPHGTQLKRSVNARAGDMPWHAGVYQKTTEPYRQICGGTLVTAKVVISAAHCFWSRTNGMEPAKNYAVALGKVSRPWKDPREDAQKSDVSSISVPDRFFGDITNYQDDIAVLKLATPVQINAFVRPACLSFDVGLERFQLKPGNLGKVASWKLEGSGQILEVLDVQYIAIAQCFNDVPASFREYITSDKFCASGKDASSTLCAGSSGGGLTFPLEKGGTAQYYLRGVASTSSPNEDSRCSQLVLYTQLSRHERFITLQLS